MKSNKAKTKIDRHGEKHPNPFSIFVSWPDSPLIQEFRRHQQRRLYGLMVAGIGLKLTCPLLCVPHSQPVVWLCQIQFEYRVMSAMRHFIPGNWASHSPVCISLNIHRMNVRYNKGMSTIHERTTSCGTSCFTMVTLIWAVFHAIPSP